MAKIDLDRMQCEEILLKAEVIYLAMAIDNQPYCLPFNFVYRDSKIYIHTGFKGKKWKYLNKNPRVGVSAVTQGDKRWGESPCQYTYEFESVVAFGEATKVESREETREALQWIIDKYKEGQVSDVPEEKLAKVCMIRIDLDEIRGRKNF